MAEDVLTALERAVKEESDSSTDDAKQVADAESSEQKTEDTKKDNGMIPRSRYNEVRAELDKATQNWESEKSQLENQLKEAQKSVSNLSDHLKVAKEDQDLVTALRDLAKDPKYTDLITRVDNALQGIDEEEEKGEISEKEATDSRKQVLSDMKKELDEKLTSGMHSMLIQQADLLSRQFIEKLPEEYTEQDKELISELWANRVDWNSIEKDPTKLGDVLSGSFQETLDKYGEPRGKLASKTETEEKEENKQPQEVPVEQQIQTILGKDWGGLKTVDTGDGKKVIPEVSDDDFTKAFGAVFKGLNQR